MMYLLFIPDALQYAYPVIRADRTAVMATPQSETKWGLPAVTLAGVMDGVPEQQRVARLWTAMMVLICTYNSCTMRKDGARASMDLEFTRMGVAAGGLQDARPREAAKTIYLDRWWIGSSQYAAGGLYGCELWISLTAVWAQDGQRLVTPNAEHIYILISEPNLLVVKMRLVVYSVIFVVTRGPHPGRPRVEVVLHWKHVVDVLEKRWPRVTK